MAFDEYSFEGIISINPKCSFLIKRNILYSYSYLSSECQNIVKSNIPPKKDYVNNILVILISRIKKKSAERECIESAKRVLR